MSACFAAENEKLPAISFMDVPQILLIGPASTADFYGSKVKKSFRQQKIFAWGREGAAPG